MVNYNKSKIYEAADMLRRLNVINYSKLIWTHSSSWCLEVSCTHDKKLENKLLTLITSNDETPYQQMIEDKTYYPFTTTRVSGQRSFLVHRSIGQFSVVKTY
jgi:hypothetical protein